jgi:NADH:ubiquinone oxidoreductase subunit 6 (subunit J)
MGTAFAIIAALTVVSAVAAMSLRNLVHCALALTVTFAGLAALYLQLGAQFVGFAQILVYIGAVAILIVFAILLTRGGGPANQPVVSSAWLVGIAVAVLVFGSLTVMILLSGGVAPPTAPKLDVAAEVAVQNIGSKLMTDYVLPLEVIALLLTAALIGAVIIAMRDESTVSETPKPTEPQHSAQLEEVTR